MLIAGYDFFSDGNSMDSTPVNAENVISVELQASVCDDLYITRNADLQTVPENWEYDTVLHAAFNGTVTAGNIDFTLSSVSSIRVKRRKVGTYNWITIFEMPVSQPDDFQFVRYDKYASSCTEYEYAIVPVLAGAEGALNTVSVESNFKGIVLVNEKAAYHAFGDVTLNSFNRNFGTSVVATLGQKYPYIIQNGKANYESGSCSAFFADVDYEAGVFVLDNQADYIWALKDYLSDGSPKMLKDENGQSWIICVTGSVTASNAEHKNKWIVSFPWTEMADKDSSTALYENGLIDVNIEGS